MYLKHSILVVAAVSPSPRRFHPAKDADIFEWQQRMRGMKREWLFSFAGGTRPGDPNSIRHHLIRQCGSCSLCKRSAFDAILADCVPVFFHPASAYTQYKWHLPDDHDTYSVFIAEDDIQSSNVSIEETLWRIPPDIEGKSVE